MIIGGFAIIYHGFVRATEDIDILIDGSPENQQRVKEALATLPRQAILELGDEDMRDYGVVRVSDEVLVDVMLAACGIEYAAASAEVEIAEIEGVSIPFASPQLLLRMKQTYRDKDIPDRIFLHRKIAEREGRTDPET